jgi:cerevisin
MKTLIALALPLLAAASPVFIDQVDAYAAPLLSSTTATEIPDNYIVVFKDHVTHDRSEQHQDWLRYVHAKRESERRVNRRSLQLPFIETMFEGLRHTYHIPGTFLGYSGHFDEATVADIRRHPDVSAHSKR